MKAEDLKIGDVVQIRYTQDCNIKGVNTILITNIVGEKIIAVWYEGDDFDGKNYGISRYQEIFKILKRGVDVKEVLKKVVKE